MGIALHFFTRSEPKRQDLSGVPFSLGCSPCERSQGVQETRDTDEAPFRLALRIFLVCGELLIGVVVGFCIGSAFTAFVGEWFRPSGNLVADRSGCD